MSIWRSFSISIIFGVLLVVVGLVFFPNMSCMDSQDENFLSGFEESKDGIVLSSFLEDGAWWIVWEDYDGIYRLTLIKGTDEVTFETDMWNLYGGD